MSIGLVNTPSIVTTGIDASMDMQKRRAERLREAREKKFSTMKAAIERFGWTEPTYRSHENGGRPFDVEAAVAYGKAFKISPVWLLCLDDAAPAPKPAPDATIDRAPDQQETRSASRGETASIIALDLSPSMGPGTLIEDFVEAEPVQMDLGILRAVTRSPFHRLRMVRGIGDSMEPTLRTGDRILVDTTDHSLTRLDGIYWITLYGAHGIKRLKPAGKGRLWVISDNRDVSDPMEVDAEDVTIEGRVIWFSRDL